MGCIRMAFGAKAGTFKRPPRGPGGGGGFPGPCRRAVHGLCLLLVGFLPACGYRLQGSPGSRFADPSIRVDLRPFANDSFVPDAGAVLASRIREEMQRNGFRGTFERGMADYLVEGTGRESREEVSSHGADEFALECRMTISGAL